MEEPEPRRSSRKPILILVGAIVAMFAIGVIGIEFSTTSSDGSDESAAPTSVDDPGLTIDIHDFAYHPSNVSVPRGAQVTWLNDDNQDHTATEKDHESWNTQIMHSGEPFTIEFDSPGTFTYYCTIHPYMLGTLTVR